MNNANKWDKGIRSGLRIKLKALLFFPEKLIEPRNPSQKKSSRHFGLELYLVNEIKYQV
jgi:hypothetical protein